VRFTVHSLIVSPHVVPLLDELVRQDPRIELKYVTTSWRGTAKSDSAKKGWDDYGKLDYVLNEDRDAEAAKQALEESEVLCSGFRIVDCFERRLKKNLRTYYMSERWFKPILIREIELIPNRFCVRIRLPGVIRMLVPSYRRTARRIVRLMENPNFLYLAIGVHAVRDIVRVQKILSGAWWYFFKVPKVNFERKLGGTVEGYPQIRLWDYSVKAGSRVVKPWPAEGSIKALWVGRMLHCKCVPSVVKSVRGDDKVQLTLLGSGDEMPICQRLARGASNVHFHEPVDLDGVRRLMREHDVLVFSSNDEEGWGAVVSEGIEEGMRVIGTYEAGSSATVLPESNLFHAGDVKRLKQLLHSDLAVIPAIDWSAESAAHWLISDWQR